MKQHTPVQNLPVKSKHKRISPKVRRALNLLVTGECKTQRAAASRAGISEVHLSRMIKKPHVGVFLTEKARETIVGARGRAAIKLLDLLDNANSEHVAKDIALRVLEDAGVLTTAGTKVTINNNNLPGYIIDLSGRPGDGAKLINGTREDKDDDHHN